MEIVADWDAVFIVLPRYDKRKMPTAPRLLDGTAIAAAIKAEVQKDVADLTSRGHRPGLAAVLVGNDPASEIYVRAKVKTCEQLGIFSQMLTPPADISTEELLAVIADLNARDDIDGILVQLPLPAQVDARRVLNSVLPEKDVDGFHPINTGRLQQGQPALTPCTPAGVIEILKRSNIAIEGAHAVVLGRSDIVGKPVSVLLLQQNATVTICHSKTRDLAAITRQADILVAAIGKPAFVSPEMVQPGATVIDVGINRVTDATEFARIFTPEQPDFEKRQKQFSEKGTTLVGDVHPSTFLRAGAYTPVPGGVGPLTIAMLMANTVRAARMRRQIN
jgi:methylenetetrahydrofolate dehydrogenase (NADP+) / methenyltetrahydrofolate cyclohydrolase